MMNPRRLRISNGLLYLVVGAIGLLCVTPLLLVLSGSLTEELTILQHGFSLVPRKFDVYAYRYLLFDISKLLTAYKVSTTVTVLGTAIAVTVTALMAYPLSRKDLKYRNYFAFFAFFTLLFNGGMVTWYIVCTRYLGLKDNIWALILPYAGNAWNVLLMRNFFYTIPDSMHESARIDGAGELRILFSIILPLATPGLATVGLFVALGYWNDWWLGLMLINRNELTPLQMLLRRIISSIQFFSSPPPGMGAQQRIPPAEGVKMATCILTIGPVILLYPYVQRYFIKGLIIGAVKE
jgi:putative aldouronate transport system permease protein